MDQVKRDILFAVIIALVIFFTIDFYHENIRGIGVLVLLLLPFYIAYRRYENRKNTAVRRESAWQIEEYAEMVRNLEDYVPECDKEDIRKIADDLSGLGNSLSWPDEFYQTIKKREKRKEEEQKS